MQTARPFIFLLLFIVLANFLYVQVAAPWFAKQYVPAAWSQRLIGQSRHQLHRLLGPPEKDKNLHMLQDRWVHHNGFKEYRLLVNYTAAETAKELYATFHYRFFLFSTVRELPLK